MKSLFWSILILPGTVVVFVPIVLLYFSFIVLGDGGVFSEYIFIRILGIFFVVVGFFLAGSSTQFFVRVGKGTPAPWDPPENLVVVGLYRYMRNPMIMGIFLVLFGETLVFGSFLLLIWFFIFCGANLLYIPWVEEKRLRMRFGKAYVVYTENVGGGFHGFHRGRGYSEILVYVFSGVVDDFVIYC